MVVTDGDIYYPAADWYRRNYPQGPDHDPRCLQTLTAYEQLYNLPITGRGRTDGGFRKQGDGIELHVRPLASLGTYDNACLTRLVVSAHRHACRVSFYVRGSLLVLTVHPRSHDGEHFYDRHPTLDDLIGMCS